MKSMLETLLVMAVLACGLTACANKGPFEEAGEEIDDAIEEVDEAF